MFSHTQSPRLVSSAATKHQLHSSFPTAHISCGGHRPSLLTSIPSLSHNSSGHPLVNHRPWVDLLSLSSTRFNPSVSSRALQQNLSYGFHKPSPPNLPSPTCCFVPDHNSSRHLLLIQGLLFLWQHVVSYSS